MNVLGVIFDKIPVSCSDCPFCVESRCGYYCACLPEQQEGDKGVVKNDIEDPYSMTYRRSDCRLVSVQEGLRWKDI